MPDAQKARPASSQAPHAVSLNPQQVQVLEAAAAAFRAAHAVKVEPAAQAASSVLQGATSMDSDAFSDEDEDGGRNDDNKRTNKKKSKGGRIASEITREELSDCFGMPSEEAARKLGVGLTVLKRICRKFGVPRWPYRKLKSLDRLITNVETGSPPGDTYKHLMKSADEIREHQRAMCQGVSLELDDKTKRLQQAYSKFNHKQRKAAKDDDEPSMPGDDSESQDLEGRNNLSDHQAALGGSDHSDQMLFMSMPSGMAFPLPMMVMDSNFGQQMMTSTVPMPVLPVADPQQDAPPAQPAEAKVGGDASTLVKEDPNGVVDASEAATANNASQMAAANAAAWSQYAAAMGGHNPYEAWAHHHQQQLQQQQQQAAAQPASASEDASAAATAAAAQNSGYYMHPMMASYMPMATAGQQGYPYSAYMSAYMAGGYDPVAMQQYYQQYYQRVAGMQGGDATANSSAAALAAQTVPGMVPVATDQGSGMMMDPNQAAALAVQQQQAAAHAAYYAHYAAAAAAQQPQWAAQAAGVPQIFDMMGGAVPGSNGVASGSAAQPEAALAKGEPDGKRKRRPNLKYEGGDFMKGEDVLLNPADGERQLKDEPVSAVAHTLMHMHHASGGGMDPKLQQQQQQQALAAAGSNGQYMSQMAAMQQMQGGGMMMHPGWAQMMMPGGAVAMPMMDMSQKQPDASGMYAGMYAMMPQGYMTYTAPG